MGFLEKLFGTKKTERNSPKKTLPVSGGHVEADTPLRCPKCGDLKRETTPRYAVFVCNKCSAVVSVDDYNVR
jgi:ribosomal protein L37AE/L43A